MGWVVVPSIYTTLPRERAEVARKAYAEAVAECLQPMILEASVGPNHPDVALSLSRLARKHVAGDRYTQAEPLYLRALAIQEKALGPEHLDVATTLEDYAALLRKLNRGAEAAEMEGRARAIRAKAEMDHNPEGQDR
jgi:tetratricopeptide (TPR) repeat protein